MSFRTVIFTIGVIAISSSAYGAAYSRQQNPDAGTGQDPAAYGLDLDLPPVTPGSGGSGYPSYISREKPVLTAKEKTALTLTKAFYDRNIPPVLTENGRVTYAYGMTMPSVVCAPLMISDIEFQPGEFVNDIVMGDTARWKVSLARSGSPETSHLIVKPLDAGLETMAVITTDRRVYHIQFKSQPKGHTSYVGFVYPEEAAATLKQQIDAQRKQDTWSTAKVPAAGNVDMSKLNFNYDISGSASWKPVQVYNDGRQTYVRLPKTVAQSELPVLLVRRDGGDVLVNYRVKDSALVVDDIFNEAILIAGVGSKQQRITIKRTK